MLITETMSLDTIAALVGDVDIEPGRWADARYGELLVNFREELVAEARRHGWIDLADVPDEAWRGIMNRSY